MAFCPLPYKGKCIGSIGCYQKRKGMFPTSFMRSLLSFSLNHLKQCPTLYLWDFELSCSSYSPKNSFPARFPPFRPISISCYPLKTVW